MTYYFRLFLWCMWLVVPLQAYGAFPPSHVTVELIQEDETIQPGQPFWMALRLNIEPGWHAYWKNTGDAGIPLKVEWKLPEGFEAKELQWPFPEKFTVEDMVGFGYEGEVVLLAQLIPPAVINESEIDLKAQVRWLVCSSMTCQPGSAPVQTRLRVDAAQPKPRPESQLLFTNARAKLPKTNEAVTVLHEGVVQLEVPTTEIASASVKTAYFFPEEKDVIDHKVEPTIAPSQKSSSTYLINLKGGEQIGAKGSTLKGVLVVHSKDGNQEHIEAFDIDSPILGEGDKELFALSPSTGSSSIGNVSYQSSSTFEGGLGLALLFAFVGGIILNFMPCVLPVISFKVMGFINMAKESRSSTLKHGLLFSLGVLISFWILAGLMLILRTYGQAVGWGFQLQEPLFVAILASLLFIFALSLFGVFEWGLVVASWAGQTQSETSQKSESASSFFSGVLATAVATPCTGPFLGSAVGFAVTLPVFQALLIFTFLGLGMCFPYLLLAAFPSCLRFLPKPGAWMETFKQLTGFILLATVLWLMWVFGAQTNTLSLICLLAGFLSFSIGAWIYGRWNTPLASQMRRAVVYVTVTGFAIAGCATIILPRESWYQTESSSSSHTEAGWNGWETFSPERVAQLQKEGKPILIDFTAKWCLICQANHMVLSSNEVQKKMEDTGVVKMKADWTKSDPVITEALSKFGRNSVPLYVLYSGDENDEPVILPQVLTTDIVSQHIDEALSDEEIALSE
jgi:thiol:disulfide interchange protein